MGVVSLRTQSVHVTVDDKTTPKGGVKVDDGILIHERHCLGWLHLVLFSLEVSSKLRSIFFWLCLDVFGEL